MAKPNRGDSAGWQVSTWVCAYGKCLLWNPSVTASPCQLPLAREPCGQCPLTISHGSFLLLVLSLTRPVSVACPPNFFTIHSSLFPKKARSCYCGGNRSANQSPPCQRGVVWRSQTGGILRAGRSPHGFVLMESACCGIPQSPSAPAPFGKGALRAVPDDNFAR